MKHNRKIPEERRKDKTEDYKGEIRKLRKQVAQLQKENSRLRNRDEGLQELFDELVDERDPVDNFAANFKCPHCNSSGAKLMTLRHENSHFSCDACGKTGPVK